MQYIGLPKLKIPSRLDELQTIESPRIILYLWQMIQWYTRQSHVHMLYLFSFNTAFGGSFVER